MRAQCFVQRALSMLRTSDRFLLHESRPLVLEGVGKRWTRDAHRLSQIVHARGFITMPPEALHGGFDGFVIVELARPDHVRSHAKCRTLPGILGSVLDQLLQKLAIRGCRLMAAGLSGRNSTMAHCARKRIMGIPSLFAVSSGAAPAAVAQTVSFASLFACTHGARIQWRQSRRLPLLPLPIAVHRN